MTECMNVSIDDTEYIVEDIYDSWILVTDSWEHFQVFESREVAWKKAREYWQEMLEYDQDEFVHMVWEGSLISWALWNRWWPGMGKVNSLHEWLDLHIDYAEEQFATYDSTERDVTDISNALVEELWFTPGVAYRTE